MKKILSSAIISIIALALVSCGVSNDSQAKDNSKRDIPKTESSKTIPIENIQESETESVTEKAEQESSIENKDPNEEFKDDSPKAEQGSNVEEEIDIFEDLNADKILDGLGNLLDKANDSAPEGVIDPDFKAFMDSYEAFMDEYIEFIGTYSKSDNPLGMMDEYMEYIEKLNDFNEKCEAYDSSNMNPAEEAYYLEVTTRVQKKLLKASY